MRTKNAKRLLPVPATVAVVALAAFLAFGLMTTTGAQPAAAQDDADCTVTADTPPVAEACVAVGDTATVEFLGPVDGGDELVRQILIEDPSGSVRAYPFGTTYGADDGFQDANRMAATTKRYRYQEVVIAAPMLNDSGVRETQKTVIMVGGDVLIWEDMADGAFEGVIALIPGGPNEEQAIAMESVPLDITFLGVPAHGEDLPGDHNRELDDDIFAQCYLSTDTEDMEVVLEGTEELGTTCPDTNTHDALLLNPDATESRSKLIVRTSGGAPMPLIDGKSLEHELSLTQSNVTVYAVIEDAKGNRLLGTDVTFTVTLEPSDLDVDLKLIREDETRRAVAVNADSDDDLVAVAVTPGIAIGEAGDAVAVRKIDGLPTGDASYRITVQVTAGDLDVGSIVLTRDGSPTVLKAGVFNMACLVDNNDPKTADDYSDDTVDLEAKGCDDSGTVSRFGADEVFFVKAHLEDSLGSVVGVATDIKVELADDLDDPLADDPAEIDQPITGKDEPAAFVYTVDEDAMLGDHMITVSTTAKNADDEDIDDVTLTVSVAGPPTQYMFVDPVDNIELGDRAMFTVQAYDTNDGIPHLITDAGDDKNDTVEIVVPDIAESLVRGRMLDNGVLTLDEDTGMGSFTIYAPANAPAGSTARIFVSAGDVEITHTVTFGEPGATPDPMERDGFTADYTVTATSTAGSGMVDVSWTRSEELSLSLVSLIQGDKVVDFNITPGMSTRFSEVAPGEYDVSVFSFRITEDGKDGEIAFGTVTVE